MDGRKVDVRLSEELKMLNDRLWKVEGRLSALHERLMILEDAQTSHASVAVGGDQSASRPNTVRCRRSRLPKHDLRRWRRAGLHQALRGDRGRVTQSVSGCK
jgi:hypothetical protein